MGKLVKILAISGCALFAVIELSFAQLNLPDMPGPPYPDKFGNNRWGVKYDPRLHGRGRHHQNAPAASPGGRYGGRGVSSSSEELPEELPPSSSGGGRYRPPSYNHHGSPSQSYAPPRNKWSPGLKPLVSSFFRRPSPLRSAFASLLPSTMSSHNSPHTRSKNLINRYVKSYMSTYNAVKNPTASSDIINIKDFLKPTTMTPPVTSTNNYFNYQTYNNNNNQQFRPNNFAMIGNRPSHIEGQQNLLSNMATSFVRTSRSDSPSVPIYRTLNPQSDFFPGNDGFQIDKKQSGKGIVRNFAKQLTKLYDDYKPGSEASSQQQGSGASSLADSTSPSEPTSANSGIVADYEEVDSGSLYSSGPSSKYSGGSRGPTYVEKEYFSSGSGPSYSRRPPPPRYSSSPSSGSGYSAAPLSSFDLLDDTPSYSSGGPYSSSLPDSFETYSSDSHGPGSYSSSGPSYSSSGPMTVTSYSMPSSSSGSFSSGPSPFSTYSSSAPSSPYSSSYSSGGPPPPPPPHPPVPVSSPLLSSPIYPAPLAYHPPPPVPYYPPPPPPHAPAPASTAPQKPSTNSHKKHKKSKRKNKKRFQHTPINVLRGMFGRGGRKHREREFDPESEGEYSYSKEAYAPSSSSNYPPASPSYSSSPYSSPSFASPSYSSTPYVSSSLGSLASRYPVPATVYRPAPIAVASPIAVPVASPISSLALAASPLSLGISSLSDSLTGLAGSLRPSSYSSRPYRQRSRPYRPPRSRYPSSYSSSGPSAPASIAETISSGGSGPSSTENQHGPITQHLQDWPKIFTAMGSSVDAVAGGIHAVRKEMSKMSGETIAKGILMGGSAVHEVSRGMANMITKMASI